MWLRSPRQVSLEEYQEFYRTTFRMYDEPLNHTHFSLEGQVGQQAHHGPAQPPLDEEDEEEEAQVAS